MEPMIGILRLGIWIIVAIMIALVALYVYLMNVLPNKANKETFTEDYMKDQENHEQMGYGNNSFNYEDDGLNSDYNNEDDGPIQHL